MGANLQNAGILDFQGNEIWKSSGCFSTTEPSDYTSQKAIGFLAHGKMGGLFISLHSTGWQQFFVFDCSITWYCPIDISISSFQPQFKSVAPRTYQFVFGNSTIL